MRTRTRRFGVWASPYYRAGRMRTYATEEAARKAAQALADERPDLEVFMSGPGIGRTFDGSPSYGTRRVLPATVRPA